MMESMDSFDNHTDYGSVALNESDLLADPLEQFALWLREAENAGIYEPNAMVVSTVDTQHRPSSRTVLLKGLDHKGFDFVTNYGSTKAQQLATNSELSLLFPWYSLQRQVIVLGTASLASAAVSDAYFAARPRDSQLASMASKQSQPIASREAIEAQVTELTRQFETVAVIPRPAGWGAVHVVPRSIEFWQGRTSRMHDRMRYSGSTEGGWVVERLQP